jgi:hypothetical protein
MLLWLPRRLETPRRVLIAAFCADQPSHQRSYGLTLGKLTIPARISFSEQGDATGRLRLTVTNCLAETFLSRSAPDLRTGYLPDGAGKHPPFCKGLIKSAYAESPGRDLG